MEMRLPGFAALPFAEECQPNQYGKQTIHKARQWSDGLKRCVGLDWAEQCQEFINTNGSMVHQAFWKKMLLSVAYKQVQQGQTGQDRHIPLCLQVVQKSKPVCCVCVNRQVET